MALGDLEGRDERWGVGRPAGGSDAGTYVLFVLALAFALFYSLPGRSGPGLEGR